MRKHKRTPPRQETRAPRALGTCRFGECWRTSHSALVYDSGSPKLRKGVSPQLNRDNSANSLSKRDLAAYTREKIWFESPLGNGVIPCLLLHLLLPANSPALHPRVICIPGHGAGVDDIVGKTKMAVPERASRDTSTTLPSKPLNTGSRH
jgi:hypothetical protein